MILYIKRDKAFLNFVEKKRYIVPIHDISNVGHV